MYNNPPKTLFIGKSVIYLPSCHSTNDIASDLITNPGIFEGTVIITSSQTAGKGQRGNTWEAEPFKNLTFSLILKPQFLRVNQQFNLNIAISLALYDLVTTILGEKVKIKWPNDIFFENNPYSGSDPSGARKICGILIQNSIKKNSIDSSIVGIGLNVNQKSFTYPQAGSLASITGREYDLEQLFAQLMEKIEARYLQLKESAAGLNDSYLKSLYWYKKPHLFKSQDLFEGTIVGIDETGRLLIEEKGNVKAFNFKEVEFVK